MKKTYISPEMEVVILDTPQQACWQAVLLAMVAQAVVRQTVASSRMS